jgi:hypothetical protein
MSLQLEEHKLLVLGDYEALVNSYNTTCDEDALFAFAGLITQLAEKLDGLISGLP